MDRGIDPPARPLTIALRDDSGDVLQARQAATPPEQSHPFCPQLPRARLPAVAAGGAALAVGGLNDWLSRLRHADRCHRVLLLQPDARTQGTTERRDAAALSAPLGVHRERLRQGKPVRGLRQVDIASDTEQANRRLTTPRQEAGQARTRLVNQVRHRLRRPNLRGAMPTQRLPTQAARAWRKQLALAEIGRLEMHHLRIDLGPVPQRVKELAQVIAGRCGVSAAAVPLSALPGGSYFTAAALAWRGGRVERCPRAHRLATSWGPTPGCRNSGETNQRLGSITEAGSGMARWLPAQVTHQVPRKDARLREGFQRIKRRRGSAIARVAVLRKPATIIWHLLSKRTPYAECRALAEAGTGARENQGGG